MTPAGETGRSRPRLKREAIMIACGFLVYFGVRALTIGGAAAATANAHTLVRFERRVGIYWEPSWQESVIDHRWIVTVANWVYIWGHWPVIIAVGTWLYLRRPDEYRLIRNAFFISGAIGMVFFIGFPVAPPRLLAGSLTDTVARYSYAYRALQPPSLVNRYAAFPSLHFGWDLLVGIALVRTAPSPLWRAFGVIMPSAMALAVVVTGNHWLIDVVAGGVIALIGLAASFAWTQRRSHPNRGRTVAQYDVGHDPEPVDQAVAIPGTPEHGRVAGRAPQWQRSRAAARG